MKRPPPLSCVFLFCNKPSCFVCSLYFSFHYTTQFCILAKSLCTILEIGLYSPSLIWLQMGLFSFNTTWHVNYRMNIMHEDYVQLHYEMLMNFDFIVLSQYTSFMALIRYVISYLKFHVVHIDFDIKYYIHLTLIMIATNWY